ncbi:MAG: hypothetical protein JXR94_08145 [Candidatus Hydrogenedentes bacterium]|nr:hypothetical protein [Candidatus Hydrogenedentota bacterium]
MIRLVCLVLLAAAGDQGADEAAVETPPPPPPNLAVNGDFEQGTSWPEGWDRPDGVRVQWGDGLGVDASRGIHTAMDRRTAETYGQGFFSKPIAVDPDTEYTIRVDVKSDAPNAIIFVKGYAKVADTAAPKGRYREVYSKHKEAHFDRYLPRGQFATQEFSFAPRHGRFRVEFVRVWLYGYLKPGNLWFDNVVVTKQGAAGPMPKLKPDAPPREPVSTPPDPDGDASPPIYIAPKAPEE